ncbi:MAG: helix-turn-helix transcriptional regulator, partial [Myxococcales bacterium]|nr:helix-turn-helix transcriptional regulator [Myxococcales bacterium]
MPRPSEPLLAWLRTMLKDRGLNTAHVAEKSGIERSRIKRILGGSDPMTVDELMQLSDALDLDPSDLANQRLPEAPAAGPQLAEAPAEDGPDVDPFGNQPEQLFRIAFALGCTFFFIADPTQLEGSGVPEAVLRKHASQGQLPIKLEAAYHKYNEPRYDAAGITLTLSFDALYDCTFPWSSVLQFVLFPD